MQNRTDLAVELAEAANLAGREYQKSGVTLTAVTLDATAAARLGKPAGDYITATLPPHDDDATLEKAARVLGEELRRLLPSRGTVLAVGLGNRAITPDALGPRTAEQLLATRHIPRELAHRVGLTDLRPCAVVTPGVLGNTGIEAEELVAGVCRAVEPSAVIAVDALAARSLARLGCTVQLCDTGIAPGSGVGNNRRALCRETLGVPVIGIGVPTVVDMAAVAEGVPPMLVTPRDIDLVIDRASRLVAMAIHAALHPRYSPLELAVIAR